MKVMHQLKPRRVIIVRGEEEDRKALADICRAVVAKAGAAELTTGEPSKTGAPKRENVFLARNGETLDATTESFIYQLRLPESLVSLLNFSKGKDGLLSWVDGIVSYEEEADVEKDLQRPEGAAEVGHLM
jgi:cleavage and polyadenylation specificity factor subunit 2